MFFPLHELVPFFQCTPKLFSFLHSLFWLVMSYPSSLLSHKLESCQIPPTPSLSTFKWLPSLVDSSPRHLKTPCFRSIPLFKSSYNHLLPRFFPRLLNGATCNQTCFSPGHLQTHRCLPHRFWNKSTLYNILVWHCVLMIFCYRFPVTSRTFLPFEPQINYSVYCFKERL